MNTPARQDVATALAEILREELADRRDVTIPNWGTFTVEHRSESTKTGDDTILVHPPRDTIIFQSEAT